MQTITRPLGFWAPAGFRPFALGRARLGQTVDEMERDLAALSAEAVNLYAGAALVEAQEKIAQCRSLLDAVLMEDASTEPFLECTANLWQEFKETREYLARPDVPPARKEEVRTTTQVVTKKLPDWVWYAGAGAVILAAAYAFTR